MAKKRINTPFIVISLLVLALIAGGLYGLRKMRQKDPARVIAIADDLYKQGKYTEAANHYAGAGNLKKDASLLVKAGDIVYGLTYDDERNFSLASQYYDQAVQFDPNATAAYQKLIEVEQDRIGLYSREGANQNQRAARQPAYDRVESLAKGLLRAQPDNKFAKRLVVTNALDRWMSGVETNSESVKQSIDALDKLHQEDPKDELVIRQLAAVRMYQAQQLTDRVDKTEMQQKVAEAFKLLTDAAAAEPENATYPYLLAIANLQDAQLDPIDKEKAKKNIEAAKSFADAARKITKPTDTDYLDVMYRCAELHRVSGDRQAVEEIYREAFKQRPGELGLRMQLAKIIGTTPGKIDEAIELLKTVPTPDPAAIAGMKGLLYKGNEIACKLQLVNLLIDKAGLPGDPASQQATLKEATAIFEPLAASAGEAAGVLKTQGKLQMLRADYASALTSLGKAWDKTDKKDPANIPNVLETANLLARANLLVGQTSKAKEWLLIVLDRVPEYVEGRILLAQVLLRENNMKEAREQVEMLRKAMPDRPDVVEMYIRVLSEDPDKNAAEIKSVFAKLPETSLQTIFAKIGVATSTKMLDEQKRLIDLAVAKEPQNPDVYLLLSNYYLNNGNDKPKAIQAITQGLGAIPNNPRLSVRLKELNGDSDVGDFVLKEIEKIDDPARRQQALYSYWSNRRDETKALEALQNWEKAAPNDLKVADLLFTYYLAKGKVDVAQTYADRLIAANNDKANGKLYRWNIAMAKGDLDNARLLAMDLTRDRAEFAQSWLSLGQTLSAQGDKLGDTVEAKAKYDEAMPKFAEALNRQATNVQAYLGILHCADQLKQYTEIRNYLNQAIEKTQDPMFTEMLNDFEVRHGEPEKVIARREQDLKDNPQDPRRYVALAEVYRATAGARAEKGDEAAAKDFLAKALDVMTRAVDKFPDNIRFLMGYSELAMMNGKVDEAEKRWKTYAAGPGAKNPDETALAMSGFYRRAGKNDEAEKVLRAALQSHGDKPEVMLQLAMAALLSDQNKLDDALRVLNANADRPEIMRTKIDILLRADKRDEASKLIDQALASTKGPALDLHTMRGAIRFANGDDAGGMQEIEAVLKQEPENVAALIQRGTRNARIGKTNDAIADLSKVREIFSDGAKITSLQQAVQVRVLLAEAYRLSGQMDRCIAEYEGALALDRQNKSLRLTILNFYLTSTPPRITEAERLMRDVNNIPTLANDPDILSAQARLWSQRKDHQRAKAYVTEALKQNPQSEALISQLFKIMLDARQYQQLIQLIDQQPDKIKQTWWAMSSRAAATFNLSSDKQAGLAEFDAAIKKVLAEKNFGAVGAILNAAVEADSGNIETGIKLIGDRMNSEPALKLQAIQLYLNKPDYPQARKLVTELLSQESQLEPALREAALQNAAMAWSSDPGRNDALAEEAYLKLTKIRPNDYVVWNNLASLENLTPEKALEYSQKAMDLLTKANRVEPYVMDTYGAALLKTGKVDQAVSVLTDAYAALKFREVCLHLAEAYIAQKQWDAATQMITEAQGIYDRDVADKRVSDGGAFQEKLSSAQRTISANRK